MKKLFLAAVACLVMTGSSDATIVETVSLTGAGGLLGSNTLLINTGSITDGASTFNAQFLVTGSGDLHQDSDGIGVVDFGDNGLNPTNSAAPDDSITISFVGFTGPTGGLVLYEGINFVRLSDLGDVANEVGTLDTGSGPFNVTANGSWGLGGAQTLTIAGATNAGVASSFRGFEIQAQFSAVPEPSSMAALAVLSTGVVLRRRRR